MLYERVITGKFEKNYMDVSLINEYGQDELPSLTDELHGKKVQILIMILEE